MIKVKLFKHNETNFKHCKWVLNEATKVNITEDTDGIFQLDLEYPLFDSKGLSKELKQGRIISAPYRNRGIQLFRIRRISKNTKDRKIVIFADCIARADLMTNFVTSVRIKNMTRKQAIAYMLLNLTDKRRKYEVGDLDVNSPPLPDQGLDDSGNVIDYLDIDNVGGLKGLNKIKETYGGEPIFNDFNIDIVDSIGTNKTHKISATKNLEDLEEDIDDTTDDFATAVIPCTSDGLYLPDNEYILYSPLADKYNRYYYRAIKYDDINFEELISSVSTEEDIERAKQICYRQLRERVAKEWDNGLDKLKENYTINFIELAKTEEYKEYIQLEQAYLGDKVKTIYTKIGISTEGRITKIVYNVLLDKVEELKVGEKKNSSIIDSINKVESNLSESIINNNRTISIVKRDISSRLEHTEEKLQSSINEVITTTEQKFNSQDKLIDENITAIQSNSSNISQLSNKIETEVKSLNSSITANSSNLQGQIDNTNNAITDANTLINNVKNNLNATISANATDAQNNLNSVRDNLQGIINNDKSELQGNIDGVNNRVDTVDNNIVTINKNITDNSSKITQLDDRITNEVSSTKDELNIKINENNSSIGTLNQTLTDMGSKVDQLPNSITSTVSEAKTELQGNINIVDGKVNATNTTVSNQATQIQQLSNQINNTVTKGEFGSLVQQNYDSVAIAINNKTSMKATLDVDGLTMQSGGFRIKKDGNNAFKATDDGSVIVYSPNGDAGFFVDYPNGGTSITDNGFEMERGSRTVNVDSSGVEIKHSSHDTYMEIQDDEIYFYDSSSYNSIYIGDSNKLHITRDLRIDDDLYVDDWCKVEGDLDVTGDKDCLQHTANYGDVRISAYETAEYFFGDLGEGTINEQGECVVYIEAIFRECVNTDINYHVFTQVYQGNINKIERHADYFVVYGEEGTEFSWEIKAKRKGRENTRLEKVPYRNKDNATEDTLLSTLKTEDNSTESILLSELKTEDDTVENILLNEIESEEM